jgi:hypothetical protein
MCWTSGLILLALAVPTQAAPRASSSLVAGDLRLLLDETARVKELSVGDHRLATRVAPLVTLCPAGRGSYSPPASVSGTYQAGLTLRFPDAGANVVLAVQTGSGSLQFHCTVKGDDLPARGLLLRLAFPLDAIGWQWHQDMQKASTIQAGKVYENVAPLRAWADLPEWRDQPDLRMGYSNRNFCTVISGPVGLCLAVPLDRMCIFRTAYNAKARQLEIVYDFALSPDTRVPHQAEFFFNLYSCDPQWGFRSALAKYYQMYPEMFRSGVREPGQWMAFGKLSEIDNVNEFYFGLQEGASEPAYDAQIGVLSTTYFTHAGQGANIPNYNPEKDPLPSHDVQVQAMDDAFKRSTGIAGLYRQVGLVNAEGRLDVRKWVAYAHLIAQFNLDPELPYGKWTLKRALATLDEFQRTRKARLDGFYYDGLSTGVNYRPDHFRTADAPCLWDPVAKKPLINNFFSSCQFARAAAQMLRPRGRITMMNGALGASFYVAPWLDVLGAETGLSIPREYLNSIRATTFRKPFLTLLKGNYHQHLGHAQIEQYMKECLAYGIFPGFFDWPTSGLGPGSAYWAHPAYFERDRDLFRKYQPLCRALSRAGWEPVTCARSGQSQVFVERFGPAADGVTWFTLFNAGKQKEQTSLTIQAGKLGLNTSAVRVVEAIQETPVKLRAQGEDLVLDTEIPAGDVQVIQLAVPAALSRWRIQQALDVLERGERMRQIDADKPPLAVHWRPQGRPYTRRTLDGKRQLVLVGDGKTSTSAAQWVMLFQPKPAEVTLQVTAGGQGLSAPKGTASIECRLAWVTPSFSYYENRVFDFPEGTYDGKLFQFSISAPHALRAIQVTPILRPRARGELRLSRISLTDASGTEYAADPGLAEWYEPFPSMLRQPIGEGCRDLRAALQKLEESPTTAPHVLDRIRHLEDLVHKHRAQEGCRRLLRDLQTMRRHLRLAVPG